LKTILQKDGFFILFLVMKNALLVKKIIEKIGKTIFTFDHETGEYFINDESPLNFPKDYYTKLFKDFKNSLKLQLKENANAELINIYLSALKDSIKEFGENYDYNIKTFEECKDFVVYPEEYLDNYIELLNILSAQNSVLNQVKSILNDELEFINFGIKSDYSEDNFELLNNDIRKETTGRATFNLGKKESLMLLYILEKENLLKFDNDIQRKKFIENNFNYTEMRENASNFGEAREMIGIGKELTNLSAYTEAETNNKTLEKLLKKLNDSIHLFEFKK
jgi:hypothetical protein